MRFSYLLALLLAYTVSARAQSADSLFLEASIIKLQHAREYTMRVAELMPEDKYAFRPTPDEMSFGEQLLHLSSNMGWLGTSYLSRSKNPFTEGYKNLRKKEEIIMFLNKTYDFALDVLKHFDGAHLSDTVTFFAGRMNKLQIINLLNDHQTHHRAQMLVYLRLNGIKPPEYVGW